MKHVAVLEDGPWEPGCARELHGLKRLKRKAKEPARRANGYKTFRLDLGAPEPGAAAANGLRDGTQRLPPVPAPVAPALAPGAGADPAGECGGPRAPEVADARKRGFALGAAGPGLPTPPPPPPAPQGPASRGPEAQPFREPASRPRILLCAPPARPTLPAPPAPPDSSARPGESSYSSISHVIYNNHPDSSASPRKRPGEAAAAASSEIKALQQTRRLLANARERTRVHTISAAFEALRKQVPCYSYGQKLSKLAILRIACNYILSLARLADLDYSADHSNLSFSECVQRCTRTLQAEGRAKKRKLLFLKPQLLGASEQEAGERRKRKGRRPALSPGTRCPARWPCPARPATALCKLPALGVARGGAGRAGVIGSERPQGRRADTGESPAAPRSWSAPGSHSGAVVLISCGVAAGSSAGTAGPRHRPPGRQTPDVPSARREGLLAPRRAEGRESTRAGSRRSGTAGLGRPPGPGWRIPQLSRPSVPKKPFQSLLITQDTTAEQLAGRRRGRAKGSLSPAGAQMEADHRRARRWKGDSGDPGASRGSLPGGCGRAVASTNT
ncbi:transcription factor ATOH8 [Ctenodactylus gundi]